MTIAEIYNVLKNPPNLQQHMIRVAKVALFISNHWNGEALDKELLLQVALLHDVGNIVKFNIDKFPQFLGTEIDRAQYWKDVQREAIEKYGTDDHEVTKTMLAELNISKQIVDKVWDMGYPNAPEIAASNDWLLKALLYADLRVSPSGIIPIKERLDDAHSRIEKYKHRNDLYEAGLCLESQIQKYMTVNCSKITDETTNTDENALLALQVERE